jgi:hypothetical protein
MTTTASKNLRQRLIDQSAKAIRRSIVEIKDGDEVLSVEVRSPTLSQASIFSKASEGDASAQARVMVQIVIQCAFDPASGQPVFDAADEGLLMECPAQGSFIEPIVTALTSLMDEAKTAAKN